MHTIFWFRRDLRLHDNHGLFRALAENRSVIVLFIFDSEILRKVPSANDRRVSLIYDSLSEMNERLKLDFGTSLQVKYGEPSKIFKDLIQDYDINAVYANEDYEPYAIKRDAIIDELLDAKNIPFKRFKDHVIFEKDEVLKNDGTPYKVFTAYKNRWLSHFQNAGKNRTELVPENGIGDVAGNFKSGVEAHIPSRQSMGFNYVDYSIVPAQFDEAIISNYDQSRDDPSIQGTTLLGPHFRFGTVSIREAVKKAVNLNKTWLNELIWREFYQMIIYHFPESANYNFKRKYDGVKWLNNEEKFEKWCRGETGYPIVDAGMRQLNETGFIHNRVRMIVAGFLTKYLLTEWQWGELYFANKLMDYELASNVGNWQWAAGTGCDAAPYFRVFNPYEQQKKYDPDFEYIKKWIPEFTSPKRYIKPIVDHKFARERAIEAYRNV